MHPKRMLIVGVALALAVLIGTALASRGDARAAPWACRGKAGIRTPRTGWPVLYHVPASGPSPGVPEIKSVSVQAS